MNEIRALEQRMIPLYHEYKQLVTPSEVPGEFHLFVFMTTISALVGDKIWFCEGNDTIYPNLWTMLVGESGLSRKSTAFRPSLKVLSKIEGVNLLAPSASPEGFFKELAENGGVGLLRHSELGTLLGSLRKDYMGGFVDFLCEIYDPVSAALRRRLSQETINIDHLAVSWIAATTSDSLNKCNANERIAGGFLPRWNIVFGGPPSTFVSFRLRKTQDYFVGFTQKLKQLIPAEAREIRFEDGAVEAHREWYENYRSSMQGESLGYFGIRILEVVKKYAVLLAFLHTQNTVNRGAMETAIMFGEYFFVSAERFINTEIAENLFEADCQKITRALQRFGEQGVIDGAVTPRDLARSVHLNKRDLESRLETMVLRGDIEVGGGTITLVSHPEMRQNRPLGGQ